MKILILIQSDSNQHVYDSVHCIYVTEYSCLFEFLCSSLFLSAYFIVLIFNNCFFFCFVSSPSLSIHLNNFFFVSLKFSIKKRCKFKLCITQNQLTTSYRIIIVSDAMDTKEAHICAFPFQSKLDQFIH